MPHATSIFDIAGPIMVGPSSSHTAGACKIGQLARALFRGTPRKATFYLHGSFGTVYQGHATDRALLAGVMKVTTSSSKIKDAFEIAERKGLEYKFIPKDLGEEFHPNTVKIVLSNRGRKQSVIGSSIGGGSVKISHINDVPVDLEIFAGRYFSLLIGHDDKEGALDALYKQLNEWECPIHDIEMFSMNDNCVTMINVEHGFLKLPQVLELEKLPGIHFVRSLTKLLKV